ncbi:MAG: hypothetical protein HOH42_06025 [Ilumatobacter sp.]|nr:hypothetical protein [Ilumatobacter sp.]MBT7430098.1 hypothetical protein [Ilumatobacter sp.]MDG1390894.1 hypothetical protein [Ilumatobacter sp.]MDG1784820.1 hypothetical protein [Ilumatobacter sp.]
MLHQERHFGEQLEALGVEILNNKANNSGHIDRKLVSGQPGGRQQLRADGGQSPPRPRRPNGISLGISAATETGGIALIELAPGDRSLRT